MQWVLILIDIFRVIRLWLCNTTSKIGHILSCPPYRTYNSKRILSILFKLYFWQWMYSQNVIVLDLSSYLKITMLATWGACWTYFFGRVTCLSIYAPNVFRDGRSNGCYRQMVCVVQWSNGHSKSTNDGENEHCVVWTKCATKWILSRHWQLEGQIMLYT